MMDQVPLFTPILNYLSDGEIERSEKEREKELTKRRKRNTRGRRGIALPDREPNRTHRTPAIGFPELDAATLALAAASVPTSRRAAAAAASLTIANMVASENGTSVMPLQLPPQQSIPVAPVGKEKKPKWLFKAPSYPPSVLRPRAQVSAPTPSTAVESTSMLPSTFLDNGAPVSSVSNPPPDSRAVAKKAKELEREAKEKEFVDGQHANVINGVWHCSNCGCPESVAIGRRKGPLGDKSQCGTCGTLIPFAHPCASF
jgi:SWI/SNF-related matrix-associated actin-dependent regulator of chromatin subfamily B protein 1